jgi:hypothetical protein
MSPGAFAGGPQQIIADLMRRVATLEQRGTPSGTGVSTQFGVPNVRPMQVGFPVELTSSWNSSTGYSWKQRALTGVTLGNPAVQLTGSNAVAVDGSTSHTSGTLGWLEVDPSAGGWLFVAGGGGSSAVSAWKEPVRVATTTSGTLSTSFENGDTVDGVVLATGNRILIKNQSSAAENGIYTVNASGAPTRATDADTGAELLGATVVVTEGTVNADTVWLCTANATITIGSTSLPWVQIGGPPPSAASGGGAGVAFAADDTWYTPGTGMTLTPGTWVVTAAASVYGSVTASAPGYLEVQLHNATTGANLTDYHRFTVESVTTSLVLIYGQVTMTARVTVAGSEVIRVRGRRLSGPTWGFAGFQSPSGASDAFYTAVRVQP